ncbi:MAG: helix-turn-helix transcriptional regulator [Methanosarcinaceae archaeon]|nr:helix-turn-helix transcriptional regulator [Methanosarcinaceae archaeon]
MKKLPPCPVETTLMMIGDKWKVLIIRELLPGTRRFSEIHPSINRISQKVLTQKLREMESDGLLERRVYAEVPPKVEYSLTELGLSLKPVLDSLETWGRDYKRSVPERTDDRISTND